MGIGTLSAQSESVWQNTETQNCHINDTCAIEWCGSSLSRRHWFNPSVLPLYSPSTQHMLITDSGIHVFILEIFIKCPLCAWHRFLISIFIRNLSFVVRLSSSSNSTEHATQISMPPGGNHWLVSRCLAFCAKSHFFPSSWEKELMKTRAKRKQPFFLAMPFLFPKDKISTM